MAEHEIKFHKILIRSLKKVENKNQMSMFLNLFFFKWGPEKKKEVPKFLPEERKGPLCHNNMYP